MIVLEAPSNHSSSLERDGGGETSVETNNTYNKGTQQSTLSLKIFDKAVVAALSSPHKTGKKLTGNDVPFDRIVELCQTSLSSPTLDSSSSSEENDNLDSLPKLLKKKLFTDTADIQKTVINTKKNNRHSYCPSNGRSTTHNREDSRTSWSTMHVQRRTQMAKKPVDRFADFLSHLEIQIESAEKVFQIVTDEFEEAGKQHQQVLQHAKQTNRRNDDNDDDITRLREEIAKLESELKMAEKDVFNVETNILKVQQLNSTSKQALDEAKDNHGNLISTRLSLQYLLEKAEISYQAELDFLNVKKQALVYNHQVEQNNARLLINDIIEKLESKAQEDDDIRYLSEEVKAIVGEDVSDDELIHKNLTLDSASQHSTALSACDFSDSDDDDSDDDFYDSDDVDYDSDYGII